jgi:hypothetical protein
MPTPKKKPGRHEPRLTKAMLLPHANKTGLTAWTLTTAKDFAKKLDIEKVALEAANEALTIAIELYEAEAYFPFTWAKSDALGGPPVTDPMTIYVQLPLGEAELSDSPTWGISLTKMVDNVIDDIEDDGPDDVMKLRNALMGIIAKMDDALTQHQASDTESSG